MIKVILGTALTLSTLFASDINVKVTNILNKNGKIVIGLFNKDDDTFADMLKFYKGIHLDIDDTKVIYRFKNLPNGIYAIAVFHDKNKNKVLDKNFLGMPQEGYGFSNNIRPIVRSATFKESKFVLNEEKNISIKLGY